MRERKEGSSFLQTGASSATFTFKERKISISSQALRFQHKHKNRGGGGVKDNSVSKLPLTAYLQHLKESVKGNQNLEEGLKQIEFIIVNNRGNGFRGRRGSLIFQSNDGD